MADDIHIPTTHRRTLFTAIRFRAAWRGTALLVLAFCAALLPPARAEVSEYQLKAAFLANFPEFVTWPGSAFSGPGSPITIGILGDDPFGEALDRAVQGKTVGGRKIAIKRSRRIEDMKGCQVVFVSGSERGSIGGLAGAGVLLIGETEGFVKQGGTIGFTTAGDKVRFEINTGAAQRSGLEISSRLLKLASRVGSW